MIPRPIAKGIQIGLRTHSQAQSITLQSFNTMNAIANAKKTKKKMLKAAKKGAKAYKKSKK